MAFDMTLRKILFTNFLLSLLLGISVCIFSCQGGSSKGGVNSESTTVKEPIVVLAEESVYNLDDFWPDERLQDRFHLYWSFRLSKMAQKAIVIEAPHIPEMISIKRYETYVNGSSDAYRRILLKNRTYKTPRIAVIEFSVALENRVILLQDHWLFLEGEWFHLVADPIMFPELVSKR